MIAIGRNDDDESGYRLKGERFIVAEYVSLQGEYQRMRTYRIVSLEDI